MEMTAPIARKSLCATLFWAFTTLAAFVAAPAAARANVLVYEGFHPDDYNNVANDGQMTPSSANVTGAHTVGLMTGAWQMNGSQPKVYGTSRGLSLPSAMTNAGFDVLGGSIGLIPGENNKALERPSTRRMAAISASVSRPERRTTTC